MLGEMGLFDYLQIIRKRRTVISIVFFTIAIFSFIYLKSMPIVYEAVATVKVSERKTLGGLLTEWITTTPGDPMASQARVAKGYPVIERAVKKIGLVTKDMQPQEISDIVSGIQGGISTEVEKNTNIIKISMIDSDPKMVALIVNAVAESYIEENLLEKNTEARRVREFIQTQLIELKAKLDFSEQALKKFKESGEATGIAIPLQNKLGDLETEKAKLLRVYTERHPNVIRLKEEEDSLKEQLKSIPEQELQFARLSRELEINEETYKNLQEKFEEARIAEVEKASDITLVDPASVPSTPVSTRGAISFVAGLFAALLISFTTGFIIEQLDTSIGTIDDVESYLKLPVLGVIPYLNVEGEEEEGFINRIWRMRFNAKRLDRMKHLKAQLLIHYSMASPISEAYKILRTNIQMEIFKGSMQNKIILVSSSGPEEGKSITCANLAIAMAQAGDRVLLIDADLRRTSVYKIFGLSKKETGLADILRGSVEVDATVKTFSDLLMGELGLDKTLSYPGIDNLNILLAGSIPQMPSELLGSEEMRNLLESLKSKYDIILIDSPPILAVTDPVILAPQADTVILVYKVGKTARNAIMRAKVQLEAINAPCKGVILNNISREVEMRSAYYYHYKYYGEKKEKTTGHRREGT